MARSDEPLPISPRARAIARNGVLAIAGGMARWDEIEFMSFRPGLAPQITMYLIARTVLRRSDTVEE